MDKNIVVNLYKGLFIIPLYLKNEIHRQHRKSENIYGFLKKPGKMSNCCLTPFMKNYRKFKLIYSDRNHKTDDWGWEAEVEERVNRQARRNFGGDDYDHYTDHCGGFMGVYLYQNLPNLGESG